MCFILEMLSNLWKRRSRNPAFSWLHALKDQGRQQKVIFTGINREPISRRMKGKELIMGIKGHVQRAQGVPN